jgi:2-polyprenyl-3-methyl-5-hydroxy-6-metoxy-1,4-benzoquinol methylase
MEMKIEAETKEQIKELLGLCDSDPSIIRQLEAHVDVTDIKSLVMSSFWPPAVDSTLIVDNEEEKYYRAMSIVNIMVSQDIKDKKFLDFGCGEGHCVVAAAQKGAEAWGYDIADQEWGKLDRNDVPDGNATTTTDFEEIKRNGPYDIVLMYDVVDHIIDDNERLQALKNVKEICGENAKVYVRCHPFTSRHGTHLYKKFNKAYAHLLLSDEDLKEYGGEETAEIKTPIKTYEDLFKESGFEMQSTDIIKTPMEEIFKSEEITELFSKKVGPRNRPGHLTSGIDWQGHVLPIDFIDYVVKV